MIRFCRSQQVADELDVGQDQVLHLIQTGKLLARQPGGERSDYLVHPVDVARMKEVRSLFRAKQSPFHPDVVWVVCACLYLANCISVSGFEPQVVVGVAFGGVCPAAFLSVFLRKPLCTLRVVHYEGRERMPAPVVMPGSGVFLNVPTLVVDDLVDSGRTMEAVYECLTSSGVEEYNIRCATLHRKPMSAFIPDWYVEVVNGWVHYPWEDSGV